MCILLAVETYGNWGKEAQGVFSRLADLLLCLLSARPKMLAEIYGRLNTVGGKGHYGKGGCL